jgi:hypothetical protein
MAGDGSLGGRYVQVPGDQDPGRPLPTPWEEYAAASESEFLTCLEAGGEPLLQSFLERNLRGCSVPGTQCWEVIMRPYSML